MKRLLHKKSTGFLIALAIGAFFLSVFAVGAMYIAYSLHNLPSPSDFGKRVVSQSTKLYDRTGETMLYEIHGDEKRTIVSFDEIPDNMKNAVLAAEDANFYTEPGFNWRGIVRAFIVNLQKGKITQGGSTLTQQLVKKTLLSDERTYIRKLKEIILAVQLESQYSKKDIFGFYLNQIPFGSNAYGVEAASQIYYNKHVKDLTLREASILASMLQAPSYFSPWGSNTKDLMARSNYVLDRMVELKSASASDVAKAKKEIPVFAPANLGTIVAPHFSLAVKDYLVGKYGEDVVMNGGLHVITTIDLKLQAIAEKAALEGAKRNAELYKGFNTALVAEDPKTGQILSMVGSKDYFGKPEPEGCTPGVSCKFEGNFNVATQGLRQPGSALKPFVYMTAFQKGYSPKTVLLDVPTEFDTRNDPETSYKPGNFDGLFRGPIRMEQSLAQSLNVPAVETLYLAGFDDVLKNLANFGITTLKERWRYGLSLTLGGGEIKLIDLVKAYSVLSQNGTLHDQQLVLKVTDANNNVLEEYKDKTTQPIDAQYPKLINQILSDSELRAPIFHASLPLTIFDGYQVALKTGTTQDYRDAWAFGYTPDLVVGVWAGNNDNTPLQSQGSSILAAIPTWNAFLRDALPQFPKDQFELPDPYTLPSKPMLNGDPVYTPVINGVKVPQVHSILYYVNRNDPTGNPPDDPSQDIQFTNWEKGVEDWIKANPNGLNTYVVPQEMQSASSSVSQAPAVSVVINEPKTGVFTSSPLLIGATLTANNDTLSRIELYFNDQLMGAMDISGTEYHYQNFLNIPLGPQNKIEIRVKARSGATASATAVVYH